MVPSSEKSDDVIETWNARGRKSKTNEDPKMHPHLPHVCKTNSLTPTLSRLVIWAGVITRLFASLPMNFVVTNSSAHP